MSFIRSESGAVTVDWTVITAAIVGLGIAALQVVSSGISDLSGDTRTLLTKDLIVASFDVSSSGNNGFENSNGMTLTNHANKDERFFYGDTVDGWSLEGASLAQVVPDGYLGIATAEGGYMIDMDTGTAHGGNVTLAKTLDNAVLGQTYTLSLSAADFGEKAQAFTPNSVEVWYGGEYVGLVDPGGPKMEDFSFDLVGGAGDGSDKLELREVGRPDDLGTYLDNVVIQ